MSFICVQTGESMLEQMRLVEWLADIYRAGFGKLPSSGRTSWPHHCNTKPRIDLKDSFLCICRTKPRGTVEGQGIDHH